MHEPQRSVISLCIPGHHQYLAIAFTILGAEKCPDMALLWYPSIKESRNACGTTCPALPSPLGPRKHSTPCTTSKLVAWAATFQDLLATSLFAGSKVILGTQCLQLVVCYDHCLWRVSSQDPTVGGLHTSCHVL